MYFLDEQYPVVTVTVQALSKANEVNQKINNRNVQRDIAQKYF